MRQYVEMRQYFIAINKTFQKIIYNFVSGMIHFHGSYEYRVAFRARGEGEYVRLFECF